MCTRLKLKQQLIFHPKMILSFVRNFNMNHSTGTKEFSNHLYTNVIAVVISSSMLAYAYKVSTLFYLSLTLWIYKLYTLYKDMKSLLLSVFTDSNPENYDY